MEHFTWLPSRWHFVITAAGLDDIALTLGELDAIERFEDGPGGERGPVTTAIG